MTLRTAGLIAGVLGLILLAVGLIANAVKPAAEATPTAAVDAAVVVVPPEVISLSPDAVLTVSGDGQLAVHTARTQDVSAWTAGKTAVTVTGVSSWEALAVTTDTAPATTSPSPSASPSASGSASPTASPAASPSASATTASASPSPAATPSASPSPAPVGSQDIWRETAQQAQTYAVDTADVPQGLTLVVEALGTSQIDTASLTLPRTIDDDWITQVIWWGVGLSVVGLIALIALFVDVRPAQTKGEEWLAQRSSIGTGKESAKPGSRRARREAGTHMPVATIPLEPMDSGSIPVVTEASADTDPVPMIAITKPSPSSGATPTVPPAAVPPAAVPPPTEETFQPPAHDDEEERS